MGAKIQAFEIFQTPFSSHYPLPLMLDFDVQYFLEFVEIFDGKEGRCMV
jgi:hypothetical protein